MWQNNYYLESKENWIRNDWATVSREAKARRGKSMKTCTGMGRVIYAQLTQLVNKQKELIISWSKGFFRYYSLENNLVPSQTHLF